MKKLIQQYNFPKVDATLLQRVVVQENRKSIFLMSIQYILWIIIGILFARNLFILNIENFSFFSSLGNIGILLQILAQILVGVVHFTLSHMSLVLLLFFVIFLSNLYTIA